MLILCFIAAITLFFLMFYITDVLISNTFNEWFCFPTCLLIFAIFVIAIVKVIEYGVNYA